MKIGTHKFEKMNGRYRYRYYKCKECGIVIFEASDGKHIISTMSDPALLDPGEISCNEWVVREIIK